MRVIAFLAVAAALCALAGSASAASLAPAGKVLTNPGNQPTLICSKHRHGYSREVYSSFVDEDDDQPYVSGYYDEYDGDDADGYAFVPERRRVYRAWFWEPAPYDNGPWY